MHLDIRLYLAHVVKLIYRKVKMSIIGNVSCPIFLKKIMCLVSCRMLPEQYCCSTTTFLLSGLFLFARTTYIKYSTSATFTTYSLYLSLTIVLTSGEVKRTQL
jgi:hypothetical protein